MNFMYIELAAKQYLTFVRLILFMFLITLLTSLVIILSFNSDFADLQTNITQNFQLQNDLIKQEFSQQTASLQQSILDQTSQINETISILNYNLTVAIYNQTDVITDTLDKNFDDLRLQLDSLDTNVQTYIANQTDNLSADIQLASSNIVNEIDSQTLDILTAINDVDTNFKLYIYNQTDYLVDVSTDQFDSTITQLTYLTDNFTNYYDNYTTNYAETKKAFVQFNTTLGDYLADITALLFDILDELSDVVTTNTLLADMNTAVSRISTSRVSGVGFTGDACISDEGEGTIICTLEAEISGDALGGKVSINEVVFEGN